MADKKISQLTGATTPLAGTEVLPIVQGGSTVKVSVDNLTKGRTVNAGTFDTDVAAAKLAISGTNIAAGGTDATVSVTVTPKGVGAFGVVQTSTAYTDAPIFIGQNNFATGKMLYGGFHTTNNEGFLQAVQWGTGYQPLNLNPNGGNVKIGNGNLVVGTAAKGIDFSANTHAAGMTSELLNWYEDGAWTPVPADAASGGNTGTVGSSYGAYTRVGRMVYVTGAVVNVNTTGMTAGNVFYIQGLPFASYNIPSATGFYLSGGVSTSNVTIASPVQSQVQDTQSAVSFFDSGGAIIVSDVSSGTGDIYFSFSYLAA